MERMTPTDARFFGLEDQVSAMHNLTVAVFDGPEPSFDDLLERMERRVALVPRLRQRVVEMPMGLGRPVWVDDPEFDLGYHLRHTGLPKGRTNADLRNLVGRLQSQRLDRGKPLWEMWMVSGLPKKQFALISKAHFAMVDGVSGTDPLALVVDGFKEPRVGRPWDPAPIPTEAGLIAQSMLGLALDVPEQMRIVRRLTTRPARRLLASAASPGPRALVGAVGPHRRWCDARVSTDAVREIRDRLGVATNDVLLGLVTWGFRQMTEEHGGEVPSTLRTLVPLAVATGDRFTNEVTALEADLPVGLTDVESIVHRISAQTRYATDQHKAVAGATLADLSGLIAPTLCALGLRSATSKGIHLGDIETVTVNAPGPRATLELFGQPMQGLFPAIPLVAKVRISVGIMSLRDHYDFGISGDRNTELEIDSLARGIEEAAALLQ